MSGLSGDQLLSRALKIYDVMMTSSFTGNEGSTNIYKTS